MMALMKIRALVAKMDGAPDRQNQTFERGSIQAVNDLPVTIDFDQRLPPIGTANLVIDGDDVIAEMDLVDYEPVAGLFPALGGRSLEFTVDAWQIVRHTLFQPKTVSICRAENTDARIPSIDSSNAIHS